MIGCAQINRKFKIDWIAGKNCSEPILKPVKYRSELFIVGLESCGLENPISGRFYYNSHQMPTVMVKIKVFIFC